MNTKQAAEKWEVKERTVRNYCVNSSIVGATKSKNNEWVIPDNALQPYINKRKSRTTENGYFDILKALNENKYIDNRTINVDVGDFTELLRQLHKSKFISLKVKAKEKTAANSYIITIAGSEYLKKSKDKRSEISASANFPILNFGFKKNL